MLSYIESYRPNHRPSIRPAAGSLSIGYNTVWSVLGLCECNEHNTRQSVL